MNATTTPAPKQRKPRQRRPHDRSIRILVYPTLNDPGLLEITQDSQRAVYWFAAIASMIGGRAFELRKFRDAERYHVLLNGQQSTCDCKGGTYGGFCKHREGLEALAAKGKLPTCRSVAELARHDPDAFDAHETAVSIAFTANPQHCPEPEPAA